MTALLFRCVHLAWAAPCSAVGASLALLFVALGGSARLVHGNMEVGLRLCQAQVPRWASRSSFGAITLGHVVIGQSHELLAHLRPHEQVHVRQYELYGPLFFVAYALASLWAFLRGHRPYADNVFELRAVTQAEKPPKTIF